MVCHASCSLGSDFDRRRLRPRRYRRMLRMKNDRKVFTTLLKFLSCEDMLWDFSMIANLTPQPFYNHAHICTYSTVHTLIEMPSCALLHAFFYIFFQVHTLRSLARKQRQASTESRWQMIDATCASVCFPLSQRCHIYFPCIDLLHCADTEQQYEQVWRG